MFDVIMIRSVGKKSALSREDSCAEQQQQHQQQRQDSATGVTEFPSRGRAPPAEVREAVQEMASIFRLAVGDEASLCVLKERVAQCLVFFQHLRSAAQDSDLQLGAVFQRLLTLCGPSNGALLRTPMNTPRDLICRTATEKIALAMNAKLLIDLIRVKIEDSEDLELAETCMADAQRSLGALKGLARRHGCTEYEVWSSCIQTGSSAQHAAGD